MGATGSKTFAHPVQEDILALACGLKGLEKGIYVGQHLCETGAPG
jgi:hypothetical protein